MWIHWKANLNSASSSSCFFHIMQVISAPEWALVRSCRVKLTGICRTERICSLPGLRKPLSPYPIAVWSQWPQTQHWVRPKHTRHQPCAEGTCRHLAADSVRKEQTHLLVALLSPRAVNTEFPFRDYFLLFSILLVSQKLENVYFSLS